MTTAGALDRASWMQPRPASAARRPSWLPAEAKEPPPPRTEDRGTVPPRVRLSVVPPITVHVNEPEPSRANTEALAAELAAKDVTIQRLGGQMAALQITAAELATSLATTRRRILEASEGELVTLAMSIAARVVGDALGADPARITAWAKESLHALPAREELVVAISSDLAEHVPAEAWAEVTTGGHRLEVDASLAAGTCELRCGAGSVEVSAEARLAAVGEAIGATS